jgi:hypothetical protein
MASTELAVVDGAQYPVLALASDELQEIVDDALGGELLGERDLMRVKVPAGGGTTWEIGDEATKTLDGVLIHHKRVRAYWPSDDEDGAPPACRSEGPEHLAVGIGNPGVKCSECPYNQFGSGVNKDGSESNGKACKENELWFMIRESGPGSFLPIVVKLPPTSLSNAKDYRTGPIAGAGLLKTSVVTRLTLAKQDRGNESYSIAVPTVLGTLDGEAAARAKAYAREMKSTFEAVAAAEAAGGVTVDVDAADDEAGE